MFDDKNDLNKIDGHNNPDDSNDNLEMDIEIVTDKEIIQSHYQESIEEIKTGKVIQCEDPQSKYHKYCEEKIKENESKKKKSPISSLLWVSVIAVVFGTVFQITVTFTEPYINTLIHGEESNPYFSFNTSQNSVENVASTQLVNDGLDSSQVGNLHYSPVAAVAEEVSPSIVTITSTVTSYDWFRNPYENQGTGSGIVFGEQGDEILIVTNYHVIQGSNKITVTFIDDSSVEASVKGFEPEADLAVIAIKRSDLKRGSLNNIKIATFGDSDQLKVGELAIAIGNPLGYSQTVTVGVVSALNREVKITDKSLELIQTDAAINPGNSGGALVNANGEVIGINVLKFASNNVEGMGFAIPINTALPIIEDLVNQKPKPYLGINGQDITDELSEIYALPLGIYIAQVVPNTPASNAGIRPGDILIEFNEVKTYSMSSLQEELANHVPGDRVNLKLLRIENNRVQSYNVTVRLGNRIDYEFHR
ncbi:serine protease Do [Natranaerovirga pectinivora]|uniref:Serine protease Do n=1 Tax=Natranaerovirga pectinivora TaxID=682400 RepID=A0A4R3MG83_9FIRM|nr:trypsin-like peptidase domain-containing protein [Natranaerovirga pectinivora]TCT12186.1 serine protease Do [Natranaerovirga pectinivora]